MQISLFQLSYIVLWLVAILLLPISFLILYRVAALYEHLAELSVPRSAILGTPIPGTTALDLRSGKRILQDLAAHIVDRQKTRLSVLCIGSVSRCQAMCMTIRGASIPILMPNDWPEHTEIATGGFPSVLVLDEEQKIRDIRSPASAQELMSFLTVLESETSGGQQRPDGSEFSVSARQSIMG